MFSAAHYFRRSTRQGKDLARIEGILEREDIDRPLVLAKAVGLMKKAIDDYPRDKNLLPTFAKVVEAIVTAKDEESFYQAVILSDHVRNMEDYPVFDSYDEAVSRAFSEIAQKAQIKGYRSLAAWNARAVFYRWPESRQEPEWFESARDILLAPVNSHLSNHEIEVAAKALKGLLPRLIDHPDWICPYSDQVFALADRAKHSGNPELEFNLLYLRVCLRNQVDPEKAQTTNVQDYKELLDILLNRVRSSGKYEALKAVVIDIKRLIDPAKNPELYSEMIEGIERFNEDYPEEYISLGNLALDCKMLLADTKAESAPKAELVPA